MLSFISSLYYHLRCAFGPLDKIVRIPSIEGGLSYLSSFKFVQCPFLLSVIDYVLEGCHVAGLKPPVHVDQVNQRDDSNEADEHFASGESEQPPVLFVYLAFNESEDGDRHEVENVEQVEPDQSVKVPVVVEADTSIQPVTVVVELKGAPVARAAVF